MGLVFLEDMSSEKIDKMEAKRAEKAKKLENYDFIDVHFISMDEIDKKINETIAKKKQYQTEREK